MTAANLAELFARLTHERPQLAEWFDRKREELTTEVQAMGWGGPVSAAPLSAGEMAQVQAQAQDYCDRISRVIRGLAHVVRCDFPELAERIHRIADDAAGVLEEYKFALGMRHNPTASDDDDSIRIGETEDMKGPKTDRLFGKLVKHGATERAMSTE